MLTKEEALSRLKEMRRESEVPGGAERLKKHHDAGKLSARERIHALLDPGSFEETGRLVTHRCHLFEMENNRPLGDGVITGYGKIDGRNICVYSQDFTVFGGSLSGAHASKICKLMDLAVKMGVPLIGINDSGGARIQEGVEALGGYAEIFWRNVQASGVIPQISLIAGPCAGGAVYSPAMTDFIMMTDKTSFMFVTGPDVIKTVTHEEVTKEELGGAHAHASRSGVSGIVADDEAQALAKTRQLLAYLPPNNRELPPRLKEFETADRNCDEILSVLPDDNKQPYDSKRIITDIVDQDSFFEIHEEYAPNLVVGFARIAGDVIGVVANQPMHLAGCLNIDASRKGARFVRFCDAFNVPIVTLVDVPGFLPGTDQEYGGIILHGSKLLYAYCEATVPKITVIIRKAYGGAYDVMASKHIRADFNFAFPQAEIAVMGAEGAINILYRKELKADPKQRDGLIDEYQNTFATPYLAASHGYIDDVILPENTRRRIAHALDITKGKREVLPKRKHGNIPL